MDTNRERNRSAHRLRRARRRTGRATRTAPGLPYPAPAEQEILDTLADGRAHDVRRALRERGRDDAFAALADADARVLLADIELPALHALLRDTGAGRRGSVAWLWLQAMLADHLVVRGDPIAFTVAEEALTLAPGDPLLHPVALYARARLRRVAALSWLDELPDGDLIRHRALAHDAVTDLLRLGYRRQAAVTQAVAAGVTALMWGNDLDTDLDELVTARQQVEADDGSVWPDVVDHMLALVALQNAELGLLQDAIGRLERRAPSQVLLATMPRMVRAVLDVCARRGAPDAMAEAEGALAALAADNVRYGASWYRAVAHCLLDLGCTDVNGLARCGLASPEPGRALALEAEILRVRLQLRADPMGISEGEAVGALEGMAGYGRVRHAWAMALRLAGDLAGAGRGDLAASLLAWAADRAPAEARWSPSERVLHHRAVSGPAAPAVAPAAVARVLAPDLSVVVEDRAVRLTEMPGRLLLTLILSHPTPVHVEQAAEDLWPDGEPGSGRSRLSTVLHRLRRSLGPAEGAVVRAGDLLRLDATQIAVDLWDHQVACRQGGPVEADALTAVAGNLCHTRFPYGEALVEHRQAFTADWLRRARAVVRDGRRPAEAFLAATVALQLEPGEVGE